MRTRQDFRRIRRIRSVRPIPQIAALAATALLACVGVPPANIAAAQEQTANVLASLQQGQLVIWVVEPVPTTPLSRALAAIAALHNATPLTYQEHDAGTFGQSASSYGTAASNYGKPADTPSISAPPAGTGYHEQASGSFGQPSSNYGTAASNYGETPGSLGQTASSYGVDASNHGHDAGTYGNSLSSIAQAGSPPATTAPNLPAQQTGELQRFEQRVSSAFPNLRVKYVSADPAALQAQLAAAKGTVQYPDLLLAPASAPGWSGIQREFGLATLQPAAFDADGVTQATPLLPPFAILAHAPHMQTARAFAIWMSETGSGCDGCGLETFPRNAQAAATVAISAVQRLLHGEPLGAEADPAMAPLSPRSALAIFGGASSGAGSGATSEAMPLRVEAMQASADGRLAAVALRVIASSSSVFGVAHPLVVLRRDDDGRWRALYVSLDLPPSEQQSERDALMNSIAVAPEQSQGRSPDHRPAVQGIAQASPPDGDTRPPQPVLWWDNRGGASLQVIEWQADDSGHWSDPRLYLAPDLGARLRTQVTAHFADSPATYRWRVWSVGARGEMKISPWSTLKIVE